MAHGSIFHRSAIEEEPICLGPYLYRGRNLVGRFFNEIKQCRRITTPGDSGVLVVTRVRSTNTKCTRGRGCSGHPAFPTPSLGGRFINGSGASRAEVAN